jgi:hypothetical protein
MKSAMAQVPAGATTKGKQAYSHSSLPAFFFPQPARRYQFSPVLSVRFRLRAKAMVARNNFV